MTSSSPSRIPRTVTVACNGERYKFDGRLATIIYKIILAADDILDLKAGQIQITLNIGQQPEEVKIVVPRVH